jgi:hypothetical protein
MRCSTNFMPYPSSSHPPSSPSLSVPQANSSSPTLANSALGERCASDLCSFSSSIRAACGTTSSRVHRSASRSYWILSGWVRLPSYCRRFALTQYYVWSVGRYTYSVHAITHAAPPARSPHRRAVHYRHDRGIRDRICARGDQGRHPRDTRPDSRPPPPPHKHTPTLSTSTSATRMTSCSICAHRFCSATCGGRLRHRRTTHRYRMARRSSRDSVCYCRRNARLEHGSRRRRRLAVAATMRKRKVGRGNGNGNGGCRVGWTLQRIAR